MKPRYKYDNTKEGWRPVIIRVCVHYDDERLLWCSPKEVAVELFMKSGYSVDCDELTSSTDGIDHVISSRLYVKP